MRRRRESLSPDLTPLIDVVFLLLVFFIVTSVFKKEENILNLILPETESTAVPTKEKVITIEITKTELSYQGKNVDLQSLEEGLKTVTNQKTPVSVRIDENVEYKRIMKLFDLLQKYKLNNLNLVTVSK